MQLPANALDWAATPTCNQRWAERGLADETLQAKARMLMADYYAAVSHADECVGSMLDQLRERGLWDNTVIVYTTDHGEMLFHHGLVQKFVFYDEAARVPLLMVRTERWKLCHYPDDEWFLFDCDNDPAEDTNLHQQLKSTPAVRDLQARLQEWRRAASAG